jgi:hypothetical protein
MGFEVYTEIPTPFRVAGPSYSPLKTEIEEYERIDIGAGYYGILFHNDHVNLWHMAQEDCGALIGTSESRAKLIKSIKKDVSGGDSRTMKLQIEMGKKQMAKADYVSPEAWFNRFRKGQKEK